MSSSHKGDVCVVAVVVGMLKVGLAVGLVIAWGSVLLPPVLRLFGGVRASDSIGSFRDKMSLLGGTGPVRRSGGPVIDLTVRPAGLSPAAGAARRQRQAAKQRRRNILVGLLAASCATLLAALALGGLAWALFGVSAVLLGAYVALLWQMQQVAVERHRKVAYLPQADASVADAPALRRVGTARS
jgi:hypothetical protein